MMVKIMRGLGISEKIITLAIVSLTVFLFLLGVTCMVILMQEIVTGRELQPAILSLLTLLGMTAAGLVTISHAANNISSASTASAVVAQTDRETQAVVAQTDRETQTAAVIANAAVVSQAMLKALEAAKQEIVQKNIPPTPL